MFMPARRRAPSISTFFVLGPIVQMIELRGRAGCEHGCSLHVLAAWTFGARAKMRSAIFLAAGRDPPACPPLRRHYARHIQATRPATQHSRLAEEAVRAGDAVLERVEAGEPLELGSEARERAAPGGVLRAAASAVHGTATHLRLGDGLVQHGDGVLGVGVVVRRMKAAASRARCRCASGKVSPRHAARRTLAARRRKRYAAARAALDKPVRRRRTNCCCERSDATPHAADAQQRQHRHRSALERAGAG